MNNDDLAPTFWPWPLQYFRPHDLPLRALTKTAALIAAEIDRLHKLPKQDGN